MGASTLDFEGPKYYPSPSSLSTPQRFVVVTSLKGYVGGHAHVARDGAFPPSVSGWSGRMPVMDTTIKLTAESVRGWLSDRNGWKRRSNKLMKDFQFSHFRDSIVFVNRVATLADSHKHHPDIDVRDGTVTLALSTDDAGGITEKDLDLAEQIDFATSFGQY